MLDGVGQVANLCQYAKKYQINPLDAILGVKDRIQVMGSSASEYQLWTLGNMQDAITNFPSSEKVDKTTFAEGMKVLCPSKYDDEVMIVHKVIPVPPGEQRLVFHHQWVILRNEKGVVDPNSVSGYYLQAVQE